jgi:type II secretory ATPase GspE/PulE/Tfp pilus assembly ATPase PilB-like protein
MLVAVLDKEAATIEKVRPADTQKNNAPTAQQALELDLKGKEPEVAVPYMIEFAAERRISDVFFNTNEEDVEVAVRHYGILRSVTRLTADIGRRCISYVKTLADMNISERRRPMDGRWLFHRRSGSPLDLRINTLPTLYGEDLTIRVLDQSNRLMSIDQLGLEPALNNRLVKFLSSPSGLVLVTGPTETGKSTTLYACLSHVNKGERKINTIEDPIEYSLKGIRQSQVNFKIDIGFDELLKNVLRQAPDVIMIGEIRDPETAMATVRAAGSGHLVLSTLHAPVAAAAIHSMLRLGVHPHMLSASLLGVISQRLLRTLCPRCKKPIATPSPHALDEIRPFLEPGQGEQVFGPQGCHECFMTGYAGRTGVFELLPISPEIRALIDDKAPTPVVHKKAVEEGMLPFRHSALLKVARGETSFEEVVRVLPPDLLE